MLSWVKPMCLDLIKKLMLVPYFFPLQVWMTSSFFCLFIFKQVELFFSELQWLKYQGLCFWTLELNFYLSFFYLKTLSTTQYRSRISSYLSQNIKIITFKNKNQPKKKPNWFWSTFPKIFIGKTLSLSNFSWEEEHFNTKIIFFYGQNIANQKLSFICHFQ